MYRRITRLRLQENNLVIVVEYVILLFIFLNYKKWLNISLETLVYYYINLFYSFIGRHV